MALTRAAEIGGLGLGLLGIATPYVFKEMSEYISYPIFAMGLVLILVSAGHALWARYRKPREPSFSDFVSGKGARDAPQFEQKKSSSPQPNMRLEDVVKRITRRDRLPLPIEDGSVDLIYACNQIREKALNGDLVVFGCAEWRLTQPKDYDHMVRSRIPPDYWKGHKIDAADSFGTDPILRRGITSKVNGGWDKTEYLWLWLDRSQVEAAWPG